MKPNSNYREYFAWLQECGRTPEHSFRLKASPSVSSVAKEECIAGMERVFGAGIWSTDASAVLSLSLSDGLPAEGYSVKYDKASMSLKIEGADGSGLLYGVFAMLRELAAGRPLDGLSLKSAPAVPRRVINHWDRIDGLVERGYAGGSIFFRNNRLSYDPARIKDYSRLLASVGLNVVAINNVNVTDAATKLISDEMLPELKKLADIFRDYGIRLSLSIHFESPAILGGLPTSDPLDEQVVAWWKEQTAKLYSYIPDFSGYLVKADSEFRGGPASLGRTQADGANMLARAIAPYGGVVYWRCFIYNCMQDWRDTTTDRPKAAYDLFKPQDGLFESNVILQVKNGPSDFQVREPNSPLLGAMEHTREALELQITQEYTGQQIDVYNLASQWEEVLSFPTGGGKALRDLIGNKIDTVAAVSNVGDDENWTGHTLAQINLYAFGRLAWDPSLTAKTVTEEWVRMTFGAEPSLADGLTDMMLRSREVYEKYCTPLGLCWMVCIHHHYGPSPEGYEFMKWGTYHRAAFDGIGIDRTSRGTGYTGQYAPDVAAIFDNPDTCPEELLLYFYRLPYDYKLKNGKTLLQYVYDTHFEGAEDVEGFISRWDSFKELLPAAAYESVSKRLGRQLENAKEWRDVVNTYFYRITGIPDEKNRKIYR